MSSAPSSASADASSSAQLAFGDLSDAELEMVVRAAYAAAAGFASGHGNYFARDGIVAPLLDAIAPAVATAYPSVGVSRDGFADLDAAKLCLTLPGTELRLATNTYGDGVTLVAVTSGRSFAYDYDPHKAPEIKVVPAADCVKLK